MARRSTLGMCGIPQCPPRGGLLKPPALRVVLDRGTPIMSPTRKLRWVWMKWGGLGCCGLLLALWATGEVWTVDYRGQLGILGFGKGCVTVVVGSPHNSRDWYGHSGWHVGSGLGRYWWPVVDRWPTGLLLPLWIPLARLVPFTVVAWRQDRRPLPSIAGVDSS